MLDNILKQKGVTTMNKTSQKSIKGGDDNQTSGDVQAYLACLRRGGSNCGAWLN